MKIVQASVAKAKFAEVLRDVQRGETVSISLHGRIIADIVPRPEHSDRQKEQVRLAIERIKELRKHNKPASIEEILAWRNEGRP